jgi:CheY-like chemotaxis protein
MANLDAASLAQQAIRLGLITEAQLHEGWEELGRRGGAPEPLLRFLERKGYLTPWQSQKLLKEDVDGYFLGGYRVLYRIASGSFGRVFRADDPRSGVVVAIKVLRRRWSENPHTIDLFEREGKVGLSLRHPNIVEVLSVSQDPLSRQYYIVMEFVEGGNLRDFLAIRKKLEPAEALRILEDATAGLVYAYSQGVTHRDIKLTNILISSQGTAKLVDFGLAGLFATFGRLDDAHVDRTVDYAGLEKATGVKTGDVRSDIYFLGCVLYELLTGRSPLETTRDRYKRMQKHRFENVPPMGRDEVAAPPAVFQLVETMMALNPLHRHQTPSQLLESVRAARHEVEAVGPGRPARSGLPSVFVVEPNERLMNAMRNRFREMGYRVLLASDPARAVDRFRQQPYDALVVDAGSSGEEGVMVFERIMAESQRKRLGCAGILILSEDQADWAEQIPAHPRIAKLVRPLTGRQLLDKLADLVPPPARVTR